MNVEQLEAELIALKKQVQALQDIEAIKKLQLAYGYYMEHVMVEEVVDCFADGPDVYMHWGELCTWVGKDGVREVFSMFPKSPEVLHLIITTSGIVDVQPDGKTAYGRWYAYNTVASPTNDSKGATQHYEVPIYENEYIKQNGVWKIKTMFVTMVWVINDPVDTVVPTNRRVKMEMEPGEGGGPMMKAKHSMPLGIGVTRYPNGYILPFHFVHPVTGKDTWTHPPTGKVYKVEPPSVWVKPYMGKEAKK